MLVESCIRRGPDRGDSLPGPIKRLFERVPIEAATKSHAGKGPQARRPDLVEPTRCETHPRTRTHYGVWAQHLAARRGAGLRPTPRYTTHTTRGPTLMRMRSLYALLCTALLSMLAPPALAASFTVLPHLGSQSSGTYASAVSADGKTVVGSSSTPLGSEAFVWDAVNGMRGIGHLPGGTPSSGATDVSADGSVVVGHAGMIYGGDPFIWDATNGMRSLGHLPIGPIPSGVATAISDDGTTVVGDVSASILIEPFIWDAPGGMRPLNDRPSPFFGYAATGVSGDGSIVVGTGRSSGSLIDEAYVWDATHGMRGIGSLDPGTDLSRATAVSADGSTIVGENLSASGTEAFIWTQQSGMMGLGHPPGGGTFSRASAVSADGSVVVGNAIGFTGQGGAAFVWGRRQRHAISTRRADRPRPGRVAVVAAYGHRHLGRRQDDRRHRQRARKSGGRPLDRDHPRAVHRGAARRRPHRVGDADAARLPVVTLSPPGRR